MSAWAKAASTSPRSMPVAVAHVAVALRRARRARGRARAASALRARAALRGRSRHRRPGRPAAPRTRRGSPATAALRRLLVSAATAAMGSPGKRTLPSAEHRAGRGSNDPSTGRCRRGRAPVSTQTTPGIASARRCRSRRCARARPGCAAPCRGASAGSEQVAGELGLAAQLLAPVATWHRAPDLLPGADRGLDAHAAPGHPRELARRPRRCPCSRCSDRGCRPGSGATSGRARELARRQQRRHGEQHPRRCRSRTGALRGA